SSFVLKRIPEELLTSFVHLGKTNHMTQDYILVSPALPARLTMRPCSLLFKPANQVTPITPGTQSRLPSPPPCPRRPVNRPDIPRRIASVPGRSTSSALAADRVSTRADTRKHPANTALYTKYTEILT